MPCCELFKLKDQCDRDLCLKIALRGWVGSSEIECMHEALDLISNTKKKKNSGILHRVIAFKNKGLHFLASLAVEM
jgi:hypothetical protein